MTTGELRTLAANARRRGADELAVTAEQVMAGRDASVASTTLSATTRTKSLRSRHAGFRPALLAALAVLIAAIAIFVVPWSRNDDGDLQPGQPRLRADVAILRPEASTSRPEAEAETVDAKATSPPRRPDDAAPATPDSPPAARPLPERPTSPRTPRVLASASGRTVPASACDGRACDGARGDSLTRSIEDLNQGLNGNGLKANRSGPP